MLKENERNLETASKYYVDLGWWGLEIYYTINTTSLSSFSIENYYTTSNQNSTNNKNSSNNSVNQKDSTSL